MNKEGKTIAAMMEKNNMNSTYGKTVCKDIVEKYVFKKVSQKIDPTSLIDVEETSSG